MNALDGLFRLAADAAAFHSRSIQGTVTVVPVIVDELGPARLVFQALCQIAGGRLLDAHADELQLPVPSTTDVVRLAGIETALTTASSGRSRRVKLTSTDGKLDAEFADPPSGPDPSGGERTVLAVARAAAHADLDAHELGVLLWADSAVDVHFRPALWSLLVDQLAGMSSTVLRTLIAVVESPINVALHCEPGRGFRIALEGGRLLHRHGDDKLRADVTEIAMHDRPFVIFLGAGFGASSRLPLGNVVRDRAIRRLLGIPGDDPRSSNELAHRFQEWMADHPGWLSEEELHMPADLYAQQLTLEQVVRAERKVYPHLPTLAEFKTHHDQVIGAPGRAAVEFARVAELTAGRIVVVEVNFDTLVETHARVPVQVFASDEEFTTAADYIAEYLAGQATAIPVLKLHGTIERPETCVVSEDQTLVGVGNSKLNALRALLGTDAPTLWTYIGASMRDRDLLRVFGDEDWARGVDERWVAPYLVASVEEFARKRAPFWDGKARSVESRLITETADTFFAELRRVLESRAS